MKKVLDRGAKRRRFVRAWNKHDLQKANRVYYGFWGFECGAVLLEDGIEHHGASRIYTHLRNSYPDGAAMGHMTLRRVRGSAQEVNGGQQLIAAMEKLGVRSAHLEKLLGCFTIELVDYTFNVNGKKTPGRSAEIWWTDDQGEEWLLFDTILEEEGK